MKPNSEQETPVKDRITIIDVRNKKEATTGLNINNPGNSVASSAGSNYRKKDMEDVENYKTSPESAGIFYEEILNEDELHNLKAEFSRLKTACYLDNAGATLYAASQLESHFSELQSTLYSNPHSRNPSSTITTDAVDYVRQQILSHFGTTMEDYTVIFTAGTTASLKLVAESFQFNGGLFAYLEESHTSVVGMRELINNKRFGSTKDEIGQTKVYCFSKSAMFQLMDPEFSRGVYSPGCCQKQCDEFHETSFSRIHHSHPEEEKQQQHQRKEGDHVNSIPLSQTDCHQDSTETLLMRKNKNVMEGRSPKTKRGSIKNALVAYPAQCNFSGFKYPLEWIPHLQNGRLECISTSQAFYIEKCEADIQSCFYTTNSSNSTKQKPTKFPTTTETDDTIVDACNQESKTNENHRCPPYKSSNIECSTVNEKNQHNWFVLLDAASYVATNPLNLSEYPADFVAISFYKMFGFPTALSKEMKLNVIGLI